MIAVLLATVASAAAPATSSASLAEAQEAQLDRLRAQIAGEVQLAAYDLVDELVWTLKADPVFEKPTAVVLAGVTVPVGLGTGLEALLENHLAEVLGANPTTNLQLVHCPACTAVVVHSGPEATVITRGYDDPAVLATLGAETGRHALFIDVEAEGTWLVLRARLTRLTPDLPIVWSHTLATSAATPALLREPAGLKSAADARAEYLAALHDRGPVSIPLRFAVRTYARSDDTSVIAPPPFIWFQTGAEIGNTDARAWTAGLVAGYSIIPQAYQGLMAQARVNRLLTGRARSFTSPDLYGFVGGAIITVWGPATAPFQEETLTSDEFILALDGDSPRYTFGTLHLGLDLRLGHRVGFSTFLETIPSLRDNTNMGSYVEVAGLQFRSFGTEVTFCF